MEEPSLYPGSVEILKGSSIEGTKKCRDIGEPNLYPGSVKIWEEEPNLSPGSVEI